MDTANSTNTNTANTSTYRRPATDAARLHANAYHREYRRTHPDKVKRWRESYIMRAAARLAAQAQTPSDEQKGGERDD